MRTFRQCDLCNLTGHIGVVFGLLILASGEVGMFISDSLLEGTSCVMFHLFQVVQLLIFSPALVFQISVLGPKLHN